jgi:hypothetical protein
MTEWVQKQIEAAKQRMEIVAHQRQRGLDERPAVVRRPALWDSLREMIGNAVGAFNEGLSLSKPLQFTKKNDELFLVWKEDFPMYSVRVQLLDGPTVVCCLSGRDDANQPVKVLREDRLAIDSETGDLELFVLNAKRLKVDEVAEFILAPIFAAIS